MINFLVAFMLLKLNEKITSFELLKDLELFFLFECISSSRCYFQRPYFNKCNEISHINKNVKAK